MSAPSDAVYVAMPDDAHAAPAQSTSPPVEETPRCPTCLCDENTVGLAPCGHRVCVHCIKTYLETQIAEGIDSPTCPWQEKDYGPDGEVHLRGTPCSALIRVQQIKRLVNANSRFKFEALRAQNLGDYVRECPYCSYQQECDGPDAPECTCEACGETFCFKHGRLHPYSACAGYVKWRRGSGADRFRSSRGIAGCPECHTTVYVEGCSYAVCTACETGFCWRCGHATGDPAAHYGLAGSQRCRGQYMDDYGQRIRNSVWATYSSLMCGEFTLDLDKKRGDRILVTVVSIIVVLPSILLAIPIAPFWWTRRRHESVWIAYVSTTTFFMTIFILFIKGILNLFEALLQETPLGVVVGLIVVVFEFVSDKIKSRCGTGRTQKDESGDGSRGDHGAVV